MVAEAFIPSFGALGLGGVVAFVAGSVLLMDASLPTYQIALPVIIVMALLNALFFFVIITMAIKSRQARVVSGREDLIGRRGVVMEDFSEQGQGKVSGELWTIAYEQGLTKGTEIEVVAIHGLVLDVKPVK
jgi:membrane-bound serine protease (ClpP class)